MCWWAKSTSGAVVWDGETSSPAVRCESSPRVTTPSKVIRTLGSTLPSRSVRALLGIGWVRGVPVHAVWMLTGELGERGLLCPALGSCVAALGARLCLRELVHEPPL